MIDKIELIRNSIDDLLQQVRLNDAISNQDAILTKVINRRATIEAEMFEMAAGKRPMPDKAMLFQMAMRLGDPDYKPPQTK